MIIVVHDLAGDEDDDNDVNVSEENVLPIETFVLGEITWCTSGGIRAKGDGLFQDRISKLPKYEARA